MRRFRRCASLATVMLLALSVGACATFANRETKLQAVKTVGIISAVGDQFRFARGGLTGLDNASQSFPIPEWGLDDMIVKQASAALNGRFQVQPVTYKREAFAKIERDSAFTPANIIGDPFKKLVQTDVMPQGLDAYIVITRAKSNFGASGGRKVEGIGFLSYGTVMQSYSQIHALYEIRVFDGKSFDVIEKMAAPPLDDSAELKLGGPSKTVDESFSPGSSDPAKNERLRAAITDLVARSLTATLGDLQLAEGR
jgi:hypothetical protein